MAHTGETWLKKTLRAGLTRNGVIVKSNPAGPEAVPGWPDWYVASYHWSGWIELKWGRNRPSEIQRHVIKQLSIRRVHCCVITAQEHLNELVVEFDIRLMKAFEPEIWDLHRNALMAMLAPACKLVVSYKYLEE